MVKGFSVLLMVAGVGFAGCHQAPAKPAQSKQVSIKAGEIGSRLPEFDLKDLQGRFSISSADLRGEVVLIDFWATWCQPCKKEMPGYQKLLDKYGVQGFVVIGFKLDTMMDTEDPLRFAKRIGVRYPLAVASDDVKEKFGGIEGLPTTMIYDRAGILRQKIIGFEYTNTIDRYLRLLF